MSRTGRPPKDVAGLKIGKLTAVKYLRSEKGEAVWLWQCDCGGTREAVAADLRDINTKAVHPVGCSVCRNYKRRPKAEPATA